MKTTTTAVPEAERLRPSDGEPAMRAQTPYERYFHVFRDVLRSIHSSAGMREVLDVVVHKASGALDAKGALLRIHNPETQRYEVRAACGLGEQYLSKGPVTTDSVHADLTGLHSVTIIKDIWNAPRVEYPHEAWDEGIRMILDVPLAARDRMVGLLRIYLDHERTFADDELDFMSTLAEQCACIIERVTVIESQRANFVHLAAHMEKMSSLGRMASGIAHEINNPLAGILLYGSNMVKKVPPGSSLETGLKIIIKETQRCKSIIQGLLEFARDKPPQRVLVSLNDILNSARGIVENEFRLRHVTLELDLAEDLEKSMLDQNQMEQVFINLLLNALQAVSDHNGQVTVRTGMSPDRTGIQIRVIDNGCGINESDIKRIFEPFFSTKTKGTGLGLSISCGIIQNHGGDIEVVSEPGRGTTFTIELPVLTEDEVEAEGP